jgi:hypothetical protein
MKKLKGRPPMDEKRVSKSITMPLDLHRVIAVMAVKEARSFNSTVCILLRSALEVK